MDDRTEKMPTASGPEDIAESPETAGGNPEAENGMDASHDAESGKKKWFCRFRFFSRRRKLVPVIAAATAMVLIAAGGVAFALSQTAPSEEPAPQPSKSAAKSRTATDSAKSAKTVSEKATKTDEEGSEAEQAATDGPASESEGSEEAQALDIDNGGSTGPSSESDYISWDSSDNSSASANSAPAPAPDPVPEPDPTPQHVHSPKDVYRDEQYEITPPQTIITGCYLLAEDGTKWYDTSEGEYYCVVNDLSYSIREEGTTIPGEWGFRQVYDHTECSTCGAWQSS